MVKNTETNKNTTYQITVNKSAVSTIVETNHQLEKAKKIKTMAIGALAFIIFIIIVFLVIRHKRLNNGLDDAEDLSDDEYEEDYEDEYEEKRINLDEDDDLFKRVNKSKFNMLVDTKEIEKNDENIEQISKKNGDEKSAIIENYFKDLDNKRKGKHF